MYPLTFEPVYKETIWGGQALATLFGRELPSARIGESWEICAHPQGMSRIRNGSWQGKTLQEVMSTQPALILGEGRTAETQFPLLIKYIDAGDDLSIQVHPDDEYAGRVERQPGKTEAWYVLQAGPGAEIIYGLNEAVSREAFIQAVREGTVEAAVRRVAVQAGDMILVPAGTVHSLLKGVAVCEIQQNSDLTYRLYDFNRTGPDGKPRMLHLGKGLAVTAFGQQPALDFRQDSITCPYFSVQRQQVAGQVQDLPAGRFLIYCILQGKGQIAANGIEVPVQAGDTVLIPACLTAVTLTGQCQLLRIR